MSSIVPFQILFCLVMYTPGFSAQRGEAHLYPQHLVGGQEVKAGGSEPSSSEFGASLSFRDCSNKQTKSRNERVARAQRIRALAALPGDLGSIPGPYTQLALQLLFRGIRHLYTEIRAGKTPMCIKTVTYKLLRKDKSRDEDWPRPSRPEPGIQTSFAAAPWLPPPTTARPATPAPRRGGASPFVVGPSFPGHQAALGGAMQMRHSGAGRLRGGGRGGSVGGRRSLRQEERTRPAA